MTEQELRELDAWIAVNIFGWIKLDVVLHPLDNRAIDGALYSPPWCPCDCGQSSYPPHYSTDRAASQEVLERCLKHSPNGLSMHGTGEGFGIVAKHDVYETTLPLAICLFAKKLFGKE